MTINITRFSINRQAVNLLETGNIQALVQRIDRRTTDQKKIDELFYCLSQAMSASAAPFKDMVTEILKDKIFGFFPICKAELLNTIDDPKYKTSANLSEIVETIQYLNKNRFISDIRHGFFTDTRLSHHLYKTIANLNSSTTTRGMTYLITGLGIIASGGIAQLFNTDDSSDANPLVAFAPIFGIGAILAGIPISHSVIRAFGKNP